MVLFLFGEEEYDVDCIGVLGVEAQQVLWRESVWAVLNNVVQERGGEYVLIADAKRPES